MTSPIGRISLCGGGKSRVREVPMSSRNKNPVRQMPKVDFGVRCVRGKAIGAGCTSNLLAPRYIYIFCCIIFALPRPHLRFTRRWRWDWRAGIFSEIQKGRVVDDWMQRAGERARVLSLFGRGACVILQFMEWEIARESIQQMVLPATCSAVFQLSRPGCENEISRKKPAFPWRTF